MNTTTAIPEPALPPDLSPLTARQEEVLGHYLALLCSRGYPPSVRDLFKALEITSLNGVQSNVGPIQRKGWLERTTGLARALLLTEAARAHLASVQPAPGEVVLCLLAPQVDVSPAEARELARRLLTAADEAERMASNG